MCYRRRLPGAVAAALLLSAVPRSIAAADESPAIYRVYWAGLPAGDIKLTLRDDPGGYRDEIAIRSEGLPRLVTRFHGRAARGGQPRPPPPPPRQRRQRRQPRRQPPAAARLLRRPLRPAQKQEQAAQHALREPRRRRR